jgi:hypothetical protein
MSHYRYILSPSLGSIRRFCDCVDGVHFPSLVGRRGRVERRGRQAHAVAHLTHLHRLRLHLTYLHRLRLLVHGVAFVVVLSRHLLGERCGVPLLRSHECTSVHLSRNSTECGVHLLRSPDSGHRVHHLGHRVLHFGLPAIGECQVRQIGQQQRHLGRFSGGYDQRKILPDDCVEESA